MYEEITPIPPLDRYVEAFWHSSCNHNPLQETIVYPDCCADIIFTCNTSLYNVFLTGAMTTAKTVEVPQETTFFGIRFKPGFAGIFMPEPLNEYTDLSIPTSTNSYEHIFSECENNGKSDFEMVVTHLSKLLIEQLKKSHSSLVEKQILQLSTLKPHRVSEMAEHLGTSRRTMHRLFLKHFGLSPTQFNNIRRFRLFKHHLQSGTFSSLADLALAAGFYDQSDMNRHVKKIGRQTPGEFLSQLYNT